MRLDPRQWTSKERIVFLLVAITLVLASAVIFMLVRGDTKKSTTNDAMTAADKATNEGDYDEAFETLKNAEDEAVTNEEKIRLYNDLAAAAANAGKLQDALEYYAKKHALDPDSKKADGYLVGEIYERTDNPQKAIEYYKLFIEYAETLSQEELSGAQVESINARIKDLEGLAQ